MAALFTGGEILELAVEIERNGYAFYEALAGKTPHHKVKEVCRFLAAEERAHEVTFARMLQNPAQALSLESYPGELERYVKDLAESRVFPHGRAGAAALARAGSDTTALEMAIGFEKDSLLFLFELRALARRPDQKTVDAIIAEERGHVLKLSALRRELVGG